MNVLLLAPGFPAEMPFFTRGLASTGARVIGLGDQPVSSLPEMAREHLSDYVQVGSFGNESAIVAEVLRQAHRLRIDQVECLWEPLMVLAARLREALWLPGMTVEQTLPFRDKELMKQVVDAAGIRTPWHVSTRTADGVRAAAEKVGYPLIVKPIAGAGSANTYRIETRQELEEALPLLRGIVEVSVEEFIEAEEFTFDTICAGGQVLYYNIAWYRPRPLVGRTHEWISPMAVALRDPDVPHLAAGREMGFQVLKAMGFRDGFTHMEWYLKADGEAVFGEIGARPPGARTVDIMNFSVDADLFAGWGHAVVHGRLPQPLERRYNVANVFKRAKGHGRIQHIEGLGRLMAEYGEHVVALELLPVGAPRRDWTQTVVSDGMIVVRHPELQATLEIADRFANDLQLYAG